MKFAALVGVSEEVRNRCHVKHLLPKENFVSEGISGSNQQSNNTGGSSTSGVNRRQKSWDLLDQSALAQARQHKQPQPHQVDILVVHRFYILFFVENCCVVKYKYSLYINHRELRYNGVHVRYFLNM